MSSLLNGTWQHPNLKMDMDGMSQSQLNQVSIKSLSTMIYASADTLYWILYTSGIINAY